MVGMTPASIGLAATTILLVGEWIVRQHRASGRDHSARWEG